MMKIQHRGIIFATSLAFQMRFIFHKPTLNIIAASIFACSNMLSILAIPRPTIFSCLFSILFSLDSPGHRSLLVLCTSELL